MHRARRQAVADDQGEVDGIGGEGSEAVAAVGGEAPAEVGPQEIGLATVRSAFGDKRRKAEGCDVGGHRVGIEGRVNRFPRGGVRKGEAQRLRRRLGRTGPPEADAGRGERGKLLPDSRLMRRAP